jgi:hypothetical protein
MELFSIAAIGGLALGEGIKFLYTQAGEILKHRRDRKAAEVAGAAPPSEPLAVETPTVVMGTLNPITIDPDAADELAEELSALRKELSDFADGIETPEPTDERVVRTTNALRDAIEAIIGQRITFEGEDREPTGSPVVTGTVRAKEIRARASGVEADEVTGGLVEGTVEADLVDEGADVAGVRVRSIGNKSGRG